VSLFGKQKNTTAAVEAQSAGPTSLPAPRAEHSTTGAAPSGPPQGKQGNTMANIGKSITIKGDLTGNEDLIIEGTVEGRVDLPDNQLTIGENGNVRAEILAKAIIVTGKVTGNVRGTERIEIQATGSVEGDVSAPRLVVAEGAVLNGSIEMGPAAVQSQAKATTKTPQPERKAG
jgi:cytoskeletal protein CcmA (bactofilin family)